MCEKVKCEKVEPKDLTKYDELIKKRKEALDKFDNKAEVAKINFKMRIGEAMRRAKGLIKSGHNIAQGYNYFSVKDLETPLEKICSELSLLYVVETTTSEDDQITIKAKLVDYYSDNETNPVALSIKDPGCLMGEIVKSIAEKLPQTNSYGKPTNPEAIYGGNTNGTICKRTGEALTYLRRYIKMLAFGVSDDDAIEMDETIKLVDNENNKDLRITKQVSENKPTNSGDIKEQCAAKAVVMLNDTADSSKNDKIEIKNSSRNPCSAEKFNEVNELWKKYENLPGFNELSQVQCVKRARGYIFKDRVDRIIEQLKTFFEANTTQPIEGDPF